jgi:ribosome-associated translation inhibitor RaiA
MKYEIVRLVFDSQCRLPSSEEEIKRVKAAKSGLALATALEEKLNIFLENYIDFEEEILTQALRTSVFHEYEWSETSDRMYRLNRRLVNVLATGRLYVDHVSHELSAWYGNGSEASINLKNKTSEEYDTYLGYRVMAALRNYMQHRGFPIHHVRWQSRWREEDDEKICLHTVTPFFDVQALSQDKGFKKAILKELGNHGERVNIKPLLREYVSSIGRIHGFVRKLLAPEITQWEAEIQGVRQRFSTDCEANLRGLAIVAVDDAGEKTESVYVSDNAIQRRHALEKKNS